MAQEEAICYRSTLYVTLPAKYYPLSDLEGIYSPHVVIFKGPYGDNYPTYRRAQAILDDPEKFKKNSNEIDTNIEGQKLYEIAVISLAAQFRPPLLNGDYKEMKDRLLMATKIRQCLRMAALNGHRRLILGAFGCGVFANPPLAVANQFLSILQEAEFKNGWWKEVVFAVYEPNKKDDDPQSNFNIFHKVLNDQIV